MPGVLVAVGVTPSSAPSTGPCGSWATEADVCGPCTEDTADLADWLQVATDLLFQATDRMYPGICEDVVRPCAQKCHTGSAPHYGDLIESSLYQWYGHCGCGNVCGCTTLPELTLSGWPLVSIEEILIDGDILDPSAYRIDDWQRLVRIDGEQWPACQDLAAATTEDDTFQITFTYGTPVPGPGVKAAAEFGCQLALACAGSGECRLPQRVQTITRQGVSMVMLDPFQFLENGLTGLGGVTDYFLTFYGPKARNRMGGLIVNPDRRARVRRVTG